jgi:hypothetical protein
MSTTTTPATEPMASTTVEAKRADRRAGRTMLDTISAASRFVTSFVTNTYAGHGGLAELAAIADLERQLVDARDDVARHLLRHDDAYREIAVALGITPQAAAKRYPGVSSRPAGGQEGRLR